MKSYAFSVLGDTGKILAEALKNRPPLYAAIVLIVLISVPVAILGTIAKAIFAFFLLAALGIILLFIIEVLKQKEQVRTPVEVKSDMNSDTINLANLLNDAQKQNILKVLRGAAEDVADALSLASNLVRANLFGVDNHNRLRMLQELIFNMDREEELTISMPVGYGSTGRCFQNGDPILLYSMKVGERI